MKNTLPDRVRLGAFEVDLRVGELRNGQQKSILTEQPLRILRMLVEADGDLVGREQIRKSLWPNDTVVEFDHSINAATRKLRLALGDSSDEPMYIETIPRRGYRLLIPVERLQTAKDDVSDLDQPQANQTAVTGPAREQVNGNLIGKKVSHYRVLEVLGGGGMGMLYKAEDLKLGRQVALKFLPEELAWDTVALQRFEREARTASSLDHPNICTIHEVEEHDGQPFIVMQLLQGKTLRDRLAAGAAQQKSLPIDELLDIATQICSGLEAAHAKGIIHRDIKPANIFLTNAGQVKILDFGLAKLISTADEDRSDGVQLGSEGAVAPRRAKSAPLDITLTRLGVAMGTAGYMSPEQVRGEKLDTRTDIFSFGLVLYEMATGQRAFAGGTASIVHDAILNDVPVAARHVNPEVPPELEAIIGKTLYKDREQRYQTAAEVRLELEGRRHSTKSLHANAAIFTRRSWPLQLPLMLGALSAIVVFVWLGWRWIRPPAKAAPRQLTFNSPGNRVDAGAISPDGKYLAFHDQTGLYLRNLQSGETHLVGLPGALPRGIPSNLLWLPGGQKLLVEMNGKRRDIWIISATGQEEPQLLYHDGREPSISPDGQMVAFVSSSFESVQQQKDEVWIGDLKGSAPRKLVVAAQGEFVASPVWSPDGRWIAYGRLWETAQGSLDSAIEIRPAAGGPAKTLLAQSTLPKPISLLAGIRDWRSSFTETWSPDWRLLFVATDASQNPAKHKVWQLRLNPDTREAADRPEQLTAWRDSDIFNLASTTDGRRLTFLTELQWTDMYLGELGTGGVSMKAPRRLARFGTGVRFNLDSWTRDGQAILFESNGNGRQEIFRQRPDESVPESLVATAHDLFMAGMSPDSSWLLYLEQESVPGTVNPLSAWLMRKPSGGGAAEKVLDVKDVAVDWFYCSSNPRAKSPCILGLLEGSAIVFYSLDPIKGKGSRLGRIAIASPSWQRGWDFSPDGSRVALVDEHKYGERIVILTLADGTWHEIVGESAKNNPRAAGNEGTMFAQIAWAADGKSLFVETRIGDSSNLLNVDLDGKEHPLLANESVQNRAIVMPLPSPDGKYLAFAASAWIAMSGCLITSESFFVTLRLPKRGTSIQELWFAGDLRKPPVVR